MPSQTARPAVLMVGPFPPAVGGVASNMGLLMGSSLSRRFHLIPFSTTKRRSRILPSRPWWDSFPYLLWHVPKFFVSILKHRPQLIYLQATSDTGFLRDMALMGVARLLGRPVLCHLHGRPMGHLFTPGGGVARALVRRGMALAGATVVLSPGLARQLSPMFPGQPLVPVANVVDLDRFQPGPPRAEGPFRVLCVGRVSREKGTWDLLRVASRVCAAMDAEFRLCGIGETAEEEAALQAEAARLGLAGKVRFLGIRLGEDLIAEYQRADAFFLPTYAEIFPTVVLEALASGLPVVTTDVPVIPEMFTEGVEGFRLSPGDVDGMSATLLRLGGDPALRARMGAPARALAEARYGVETAAVAVGDLLAALAEHRPIVAP